MGASSAPFPSLLCGCGGAQRERPDPDPIWRQCRDRSRKELFGEFAGQSGQQQRGKRPRAGHRPRAPGSPRAGYRRKRKAVAPKSWSQETSTRSWSRAQPRTAWSSALVRPISATCTASCPAAFKGGQTRWETFSSSRNLMPGGTPAGGTTAPRTPHRQPPAGCHRLR